MQTISQHRQRSAKDHQDIRQSSEKLLLSIPSPQCQEERREVLQLSVKDLLIYSQPFLPPPPPQDQDTSSLGHPDPYRLLQQSVERLPPAAYHKEVIVICWVF